MDGHYNCNHIMGSHGAGWATSFISLGRRMKAGCVYEAGSKK